MDVCILWYEVMQEWQELLLTRQVQVGHQRLQRTERNGVKVGDRNWAAGHGCDAFVLLCRGVVGLHIGQQQKEIKGSEPAVADRRIEATGSRQYGRSAVPEQDEQVLQARHKKGLVLITRPDPCFSGCRASGMGGAVNQDHWCSIRVCVC